MSILKRLMLALGWGGARISIKTENNLCPRGTEVRGTIEISGGSLDQQLNRISVRLVEFREGKNQLVIRVLGEVCPAYNRPVARRSVQGFPFQFRIPDDARITKESWSRPYEGCRIDARASFGWFSAGSTAGAKLVVTEHREIEAVKVAMLSMGFTETSWYLHHLFVPEWNSTAAMAYDAPDKLREHLDGVSLIAQVEGDCLTGRLIVNLREMNLAEKLKALVGGNRQEYPLKIKCSELLTREGKPNYLAAVPHMERILNEAVLPLQNDPRYRLLRPTNAPADENTLLRPAAHGSGEADQQLLRPTTGPSQPNE